MFYLVSTPIGNLQDITFRAIEVLKEADIVFCEDTRHSLKLLNHYGIKKQLESFHQFSKEDKLRKIEKLLNKGKKVCYISDAGTPAISDPGYEIIKYLSEKNIPFDVIPGATALIPALLLSSFPPDRFFFGGFLGKKESEIENQLKRFADYDCTLIFYQSPLRIARTLKVAREVYQNRQVAIVKELTKIHQKVLKGSIDTVVKEIKESEKGEFVIVFSPPEKKKKQSEIPEGVKNEYAMLLKEKIEPKKAIKFLSKKYSIPSKKLYSELSEG